MRAIPKPTYAPNAAFDACVCDTKDGLLRSKLTEIAPEMLDVLGFYVAHAGQATLHTVPPSAHNDAERVIRQVTKGELKDLYDKQMIPRRKTARAIYDNLRAAAPGGICPTCGFGHVETIDHFLPKSSYPWFSVLPENLIPSCRSCNTGKSAVIADDSQYFHPYYDIGPLMHEQWLYADILFTNPISIWYEVRPPSGWTDAQKLRAKNHFRDYNLRSRFGVQAAAELSLLIPQFSDPPMDIHEIRDALDRKLRAARRYETNSWRIALYEALGNSVTFCSLGFPY